jgi:putative DNA primase/helicase
MNNINNEFQRLNEQLKPRYMDILLDLLPGGRLIGKEYTCADINGGHGDSFKFNVESGLWSDFATDHQGIDIISLKATIDNTTQIEAARDLVKYTTLEPGSSIVKRKDNVSIPQPPLTQVRIGDPPDDAPPPDTKGAVGVWRYTDAEDKTKFYMLRYQGSSAKKIFVPLCWDLNSKRWVRKAYPSPRPLYNLPEVVRKDWILLVEGEKACDAAQQIVGDVYACTTWPNGSKSYNHADFTPLHGKNLLLWPDSDHAGVNAMQAIATKLIPHCRTIKIFEVEPDGFGYDAYDFLQQGNTYSDLKRWAADKTAVVSENGKRATHSEDIDITGPSPIEPTSTGDSLRVAMFDDTVPAEHFDGLFKFFTDGHAAVDIHTEAQIAVWEKLGLAMTNTGGPIPNVDNMCRILDGLPQFKGRIWKDTFHKKTMTNISTPSNKSNDVREWTNEDTNDMQIFIQRYIGMTRVTEVIVWQGVQAFARYDCRSEPLQWMESLEWDGVARIENCFERYFGAASSEYVRSASKNFFVSMIARVYGPGCQVDYMPVLESPQGTGKSTALSILGGKWHIECVEAVTTNNFFQALQGRLIVEIAEMSSFPSTQVQRIKQIISNRVDSFRAPYERAPQEHKRQNVFVGTTNDKKYLHDDTGNRRFWPIECGASVDLDAIARDRGQLFAEAVKRYKDGEKWHIMPAEATLKMQESRRQVDPWESIVFDRLRGKQEISVVELASLIGVPTAKMDIKTTRRLVNGLVKSGWVESSPHIWTRPDLAL